MRVHIRKWGNSLALRIPKPFAVEASLAQGSPVDLVLEDGRLVIQPVEDSEYDLAELLAQVTDANRHSEIDTGASVGREEW